MLDTRERLRLLDGLVQATQEETLEWDSVNPPNSLGSSVVNSLAQVLGRGPSFVATAASARYHLGSGYEGRAPFKLEIWDSRESRNKLIDSIASSTNVVDGDALRVNNALSTLYAAVNATVEPSAEVVDRLLGEIAPKRNR